MTNYVEGKAFVPDITDKKLDSMINKIVPVVEFKNKLWKIVLPNLRNKAYTWSPEITEVYNNLEELTRIPTHHYCGYAGFFKPSIAEVLSQIPEEFVSSVVAFRILKDDVTIFQEGNGQLAITILYKVKE